MNHESNSAHTSESHLEGHVSTLNCFILFYSVTNPKYIYPSKIKDTWCIPIQTQAISSFKK